MFAVSVLRPSVRSHTYKRHYDRASVLHRLWATMASALGEWRRRLCDRRALAAMSDRSLRDIGITRFDALREADKPFWRE